MRSILLSSLVLLLPSLAFSQTRIVDGRTINNFYTFNVSAPAPVRWEVSDDHGTDLTLSVPSTAYHEVLLLATADTAASQGVDWSAWYNLLATPTTLHSAITWNGLTQTGSLVVPDHFALGKLQLWAVNWFWPPSFNSDPFMRVGGLATEFVTVPEPSSFLLLLMIAPVLRIRQRRANTDGHRSRLDSSCV